MTEIIFHNSYNIKLGNVLRVSLRLIHTVHCMCTQQCCRRLLRRLLCLKSAFGLAGINQVVLYRELLLSDWEPRLHLNHQHPRSNSHRWFSTTVGILEMISALRQILGCEFTPLFTNCVYLFQFFQSNMQTVLTCTYSQRIICNGLAMVYVNSYVKAFKDFNSSKCLAFPF